MAAWRWAYRGVMPDDVLDSLSEESRAAQWEVALEQGESMWVAEADGEIVGFASQGAARDEDLADGTVELLTLYVVEDVLGTGVGSALTAAVEDEWRARGIELAVLWVAVDNQLGRAFYERHGWTPDGTRKLEHVRDDEAIEAVRYAKSIR